MAESNYLSWLEEKTLENGSGVIENVDGDLFPIRDLR